MKAYLPRINRSLYWLPFSALLLSGCGASIQDYNDTHPRFDLDQYFVGDITAWGMVQDYSGKVTRRFCVEMTGQWQAENGELRETFYFNDGEVSYRNWLLTRQANTRFTGTAEDVIGTAQGEEAGFAFQWEYTLALKIDDDTYNLALDDWMYRIDEHRLFNRTEMKKFGITVAEITLFFDKQTPQRRCADGQVTNRQDAREPLADSTHNTIPSSDLTQLAVAVN